VVKCISIIANFGIFCNISVMIIKLHTLSPNHKNRRVRCMAGGWCQLGVTAADLDKRLYAAFYSGPLATCHSMTPQQVLRCNQSNQHKSRWYYCFFFNQLRFSSSIPHSNLNRLSSSTETPS
jgi:hypothetical protein